MAIIGIDLGTSNSAVSYFDKGEVKLIPNVFKNVLTPSVVSINEDNEIIVGETAKERLITHQDQTFSVFKRFMGTKKIYEYDNYCFSSTDLSSFILKQLKEDAEVFLNEECNQAIISVPAYFNNKQRQATISAAKLAGLEVIKLISEPTAAALSYGFHEFEDDSTIVVLDLGGGTFDVSIMEMFDGILQVRAIAGNNLLGGEDFTKLIINDFLKKNNISMNDIDNNNYAKLYVQCEKLKKEINYSKKKKDFNVQLTDKDYNYSLSFDEYKDLAYSLFMDIRLPIIKALNDAESSIFDIDTVILMGGATKMPIFKEFAEIIFEKNVRSDINPDETVAMGAGVAVGLYTKNIDIEEMMMTDVCGFSLGTEIANEKSNSEIEEGIFYPIISRNSTIPISRVDTFYTIGAGQDVVEVGIYQGESRLVKGNLKLGNLDVKLPRKAAEQSINVRFTYDVSGVLEVEVEIEETKEVKRIVIKDDDCMLTDTEIKSRLKELEHLKTHPRDMQENSLLLARANSLYEFVVNENRLEIDKIISEFNYILETQDASKIKKGRIDFQRKIESFERQIEEVLLGDSGDIFN